jgi:large subunit ribosomal protein L32
MAEPKQRTNTSKQGMRRMHDKIKVPNLNYCEKCHEPKLPHQVCYACGTYNKEQVFAKKQ